MKKNNKSLLTFLKKLGILITVAAKRLISFVSGGEYFRKKVIDITKVFMLD